MKKRLTKKQSLHVKVGESVKVIAGQDKGKIGIVKALNPKTSKVLVEGINFKVKHIQPKRARENGQIQKFEFPIHSSNLFIYKD